MKALDKWTTEYSKGMDESINEMFDGYDHDLHFSRLAVDVKTIMKEMNGIASVDFIQGASEKGAEENHIFHTQPFEVELSDESFHVGALHVFYTLEGKFEALSVDLFDTDYNMDDLESQNVIAIRRYLKNQLDNYYN